VSLCPEPEQLAAERLAENFSLHPKPSIRYSTKAIKLFGCCDLPRSFEVIFLQFFEVFSALDAEFPYRDPLNFLIEIHPVRSSRPTYTFSISTGSQWVSTPLV
jgi:hypothetical protein